MVFNSFKDLSGLKIEAEPEIVRSVSEEELKAYIPTIQRKSLEFTKKFNKDASRNVNACIPQTPYANDDIEQELLIHTWMLLNKYTPKEVEEKYPGITYRNFILSCLDKELFLIKREIFALKRGRQFQHSTDDLLFDGEYNDDLF